MLWALRTPSSSVSTLVICRMDALAVGMLAAALTRGDKPLFDVRRHVTALLLSLRIFSIGVAFLWKFSPHASDFAKQTIGLTWMAFFYATILLLANGHTSGWIARLLRIGWLHEISAVSYCIYIVHIVVNVVSHALFLHKVPRISTGKGAAVTFLAAALTYAVAKLSWILLESPMQRRGHAFKY